MNEEVLMEDPNSLNLTQSRQNMEGYWEIKRQEQNQQQPLEPLDTSEDSEEAQSSSPEMDNYIQTKNQEEEAELERIKNSPAYIEAVRQQEESKPLYETGKQHKNIINHPHYETLKGDIPFDPDELSKDHPNHEAIYGGTARFHLGNALAGPFGSLAGAGGPADDKMELYNNRKHMFTSGSGTADLATNIMEAQNTLTGAAYQVVNGVLQLPETTGRIISGQNPFSQDFDLTWDPLASVGLEEPWTGTSLGDAGKVIGSFSVGGAGTAGLLSKLSKVKKLGKVAGFLNGLSNTQKVMLSEALYMQASNYRLDPGLANLLEESTFFGDTPVFKEALGLIAVGEHDHPMVKQLKNTLESVGMVGLFGKIVASFSPKPGSPRALLKELDAAQIGNALEETEVGRILNNISEQSDEMGRAQLFEDAQEYRTQGVFKGSRFRADKNRSVAAPWQGAHISTNSPGKIYAALNKIDDMGGYGSVDAPMTARQAELGVNSPEFTAQFLREEAGRLLGEPYVQGLLNDIKETGQTFEQIFEPAYRRFQETIGGNASTQTREEFWEPILKKIKENVGEDGYTEWAMENIVAADMVNNALFKQIRDSSVMARQVHNIADIFATDSVMKPIAENLAFGLSNVKRGRYMLSSEFTALKGKAATEALAARTALLHDETVDGVRLMMQFLKDSNSDELAQGILEVFSMSNKIKNFNDFDAWMRQKLIGGDFADASKQGVMMKELSAVMINSILSSPKTPLRAIIGTTANAYLNEAATLLGSTIRRGFTGDVASMRAAAASSHAMFDLIPDAWKIFRSNLDANWQGDMASIKSRYSQYSAQDVNFELMGNWVERSGNNGDKAAFYIANHARNANNNRLFTWSTRVLGATDDTFRWLLSKSRARKRAIESLMSEFGEHVEVTPKMLKDAEDIEWNRLHDAQGNLDITKDPFLERNFKEVTLTTELEGFSKGLNTLMNSYPLTKPFFLFARTGINGLRMSVKNLPIVGAVINESRAILGATPQMVEAGHLLKYGIETASDLRAAKSLITGRQAIGSLVVYGVAQKYMAGQITGNGPADQSMKKLWIDSGWKPRSIKIGDTWVSYDSFEPFNLVMANIADVGDNMDLMGPQYSEERFQLIVAALGQGVTSKTYLQGLSQLMDLVSNQSGYNASRVIANLANNQVPLAGMRNEIGKVLNPGMRELSSNFWDHVSNRNPILRGALPNKYDTLNGKVINHGNFMTRAFNAVSPIQLNLENSPGRKFLFESGYDLRLFAYTAPGGISLTKHPRVRSLFQESIGKYNLEAKLNELVQRPDIQDSLRQMKEDRNNGNYALNPMKAYMHNKAIAALFKSVTKPAWADIRDNPLVKPIIQEHQSRLSSNKTSLFNTRQIVNYPK